MNENVIHDLIMLYLTNSGAITSSVPAEEYADIYLETHKRISIRLQELKGTRPVARKAGVINKGL